MADTDESNPRQVKAEPAGAERQDFATSEGGNSAAAPGKAVLPMPLKVQDSPEPATAPATPAGALAKPKALLAGTAATTAITAPAAATSTKPRKFVAAARKPASAKAARMKTPAAQVPPAAAAQLAPPPAQPQPGATASSNAINQPQNFTCKDVTMDMTANLSGFQDAMTEAQAKAQAAFEKSTNVLGEVSEFAKGNLEALVESGKILAGGVQDLGSTLVSESRTAFESATSDIKELAAAKSPTDFLKLQSDMMRKSFDTAVAYGSKNSEAMLKLMSEAMAPLSGRVSLAVEKARQTATL